MREVILFLIILLFFLFEGCADNTITYEFNSYCIKGCNQKYFRHIEILNKKDLTYAIVTQIGEEKINKFNIKGKNPSFKKISGNLPFSPDSIFIKPSVTYLITNLTNGDAVSQSIEFAVDKDKNIILLKGSQECK